MAATNDSQDLPRAGQAPARLTDTGCQRVLERIQRLDPRDAEATAADLIAELEQHALPRLRFALRERLLEAIGAMCFQVLPGLQASLQGSAAPLDARYRTLYELADTLLERLDQGYRDLLDGQTQRLFGMASRGHALLPLVRSMQIGHERLALAWNAWSRPPRGLWIRMHALYHLAASRGLARRALAGGETSPEILYKRALLTAFADPYHFMPGEYASARSLIDTHAGLAQLAQSREGQRRAGLFVVRSGRDHAGYAASKAYQTTPRPDDLVLDAAPAAAAIAAAITTPRSGDALGAHQMGERLALRWGSPPARRSSRLGVHTRVALRTGLEAIWLQLAEGTQPGEGLSQWLITNEAAEGCSLLHLSGSALPIHPGDLISLAPLEVPGLHVGIVRWIRARSKSQIEVGIETLSSHARAVRLHAKPHSTEADPAICAVKALLLPDDPHQNRCASIVMPIVMPTGSGEDSAEMTLIDRQSQLVIRPTGLLERLPRLQRVQFSPGPHRAEGDSSRLASG